jgi:hypothetical protein
MSHDRADWHYGGDFPEDLPPEAGATHIGMFLAWAITRGLHGSLHEDDSSEALSAVRGRRMTGRDFLMTECDEKFVEEDLNDEGNAFTEAYYMKEGAGGYLADYEEALGDARLPSLYHIEDTWENFDRLVPILDKRCEEWRIARRPDAR